MRHLHDPCPLEHVELHKTHNPDSTLAPVYKIADAHCLFDENVFYVTASIYPEKSKTAYTIYEFSVPSAYEVHKHFCD